MKGRRSSGNEVCSSLESELRLLQPEEDCGIVGECHVASAETITCQHRWVGLEPNLLLVRFFDFGF